MLPPSKIFRSPDVLFQEVSGEAVLLDLKSESYFGLNRIGTRIWRLLESSSDPQALLVALMDEFDVGREQLERDVGRLIGELTAAGLVKLEPGDDNRS